MDECRLVAWANGVGPPYRGYFEARGCPLPPEPGEEPDYRKLSLVLLSSDEETPAELIETLFVIGDLGIEKRFDDLMEVAILNGIDVGPDATPTDLSLRLWLKVPKALTRSVRDELFQKRLKFEDFPAQADATAIPVRDLPFDLSALEAELDSWYQEHGRGPGCTISRADSKTQARFLIEHGRPCKRERNRKGRESSLLYYRPEKIDMVVYDAATNEFHVHADGIREMRMYLQAFGKHVFGREDQFTYREKYTLEPLKLRGRDSRNCRGIEGLEVIRLREIGGRSKSRRAEPPDRPGQRRRERKTAAETGIGAVRHHRGHDLGAAENDRSAQVYGVI